jgi:hypothetical protein
MHIPRITVDPKNIDLGPCMDGRMRMENPWIEIQREGPFVLEIDREAIECYNDKKRKPDQKIDTLLIPEPFIGNPRSAKLVLLSLNPGREEKDAEAHAIPEFREAMLRNLRHQRQKYPFYPLNPAFERTPCAKYWRRITRELLDGIDHRAAGEKLLAIDWFPYHSNKSGLPKKPKQFLCESQRYSCQLAKEMVGKGALMVLLRSKDHWGICEEGLSKLPLPKSRQNPVITPNNFGEDVFRQMRQALI